MLARCFVCLFFAILFLQSGIDKVVDWQGNLAWLRPHFEKSPLAKAVPLLVASLTFFELASGCASLVAVPMLVFAHSISIAQVAICLCALTFLMLFLGQRLAKDYAGAASIAGYFAVAVLGLFLMNEPVVK